MKNCRPRDGIFSWFLAVGSEPATFAKQKSQGSAQRSEIVWKFTFETMSKRRSEVKRSDTLPRFYLTF